MNPLTIIRKIGKFVRGGAGAPQIILACSLGLTLGMIPGFSLTPILLILAIILLNVSLGVTLLMFSIGKLASMALAPVTFGVGYGAIHSVGLEGLFIWAGNTPLLALLDLHVYCLTGGLIVGAILGLIMGLFLARLVMLLRRGLAAAGQRSATVNRISQNIFVRFFLRVLFGKSKRPLAELLNVRYPLVRTSGVIVTVVLAVIFIGAPILLVDHLLARTLADNLSQINGAEVNVAEADISIFSGRLAIAGIQVTDRDNPSHNAVFADRLVSDISIADLLAKRIVIDRLEIDRVRTNVPRETVGEVYPRVEKPEDPEADDAADFGRRVLDYFENAKEYEKYLDYLKQVADYLRREDRRQEGKPPVSAEELRAQAYFARTAAHMLVRHPRLRIRELVIDRVLIGDSEFRLLADEFASEPALNPNAMSIRFGSLEGEGDSTVFARKQRLFMNFGFHQEDQAHALDMLLSDLPVGGLSSRVPVDVSGGIADFSARGTFSHAALDLPFAVAVRELKSQAQPDKSVLGLSPAASQRLMSNIDHLTLAGIIGGRLAAPRLNLDEKATLEGMKAALTGAARNELLGQIDSQLTKLGPGLDIKTDDLLKSPVIPAGLLPSLPDKDAGDEGESSGGGLFDRLRRR